MRLSPSPSAYTTVDPLPFSFFSPTISVFILGSSQFSISHILYILRGLLGWSIESTALGWTGVIIYSGLNNHLSPLHVSYGRRIVSLSSLVHIAKRNGIFFLVLRSMRHPLARVETLKKLGIMNGSKPSKAAE
jgi:hypothetical protein